MFCISSSSTVSSRCKEKEVNDKILDMPVFYPTVRLRYANLFLEKRKKREVRTAAVGIALTIDHW